MCTSIHLYRHKREYIRPCMTYIQNNNILWHSPRKPRLPPIPLAEAAFSPCAQACRQPEIEPMSGCRPGSHEFSNYQCFISRCTCTDNRPMHIYLTIYVSVCLPVYLSVYLPTYNTTDLYIHLYIHIDTHLYVYVYNGV